MTRILKGYRKMLRIKSLYVCTPMLLLGCSLDSLVKVDDPEQGREVQIGEVTTKAGALAVYANAIGQFQKGVNGISRDVSLFTDERGAPANTSNSSAIDARVETRSAITSLLGLVVQEPYQHLNSARITFLQVRDIIRGLNDPSLHYLISASYALEGYSILMLAENYCSGIPLSKLTFDGSVRYAAGSSTVEALKIAVSLFDSSQMVAHDSTRFKVLSQVGKGRAYLSLEMLDSAFESVQNVDVADVFSLHYSEAQIVDVGAVTRPYSFWSLRLGIGSSLEETKNYEGINGMEWFSLVGNSDVRVSVGPELVQAGVTAPMQQKYPNGAVVFPLARGMERKMIESEYWLSKGDSRWLNAINEARQTRGIQDTVDPGTLKERVDLLFRERALWFYLEGQRLADYRRLVRQYDRSPYEIYPAGIYVGGNGTYQIYGDAFVFSPPEAPNRQYLGCDHKQP